MIRRTSCATGLAVAFFALALSNSPAFAALGKGATVCQKTIGKEGLRFQQTEARVWRECLDNALAGKECDIAGRDADLASARSRFQASVADKCPGDVAFAALPDGAGFPKTCALVPGAGGAAEEACSALPVNSASTLADCLLCWKDARVRRHLDVLYPCLDGMIPDGSPRQCGTAPTACPADKDEAACVSKIAAAEMAAFLASEKALQVCLDSVASGKSAGPCPDADATGKVARALAKKQSNLEKCAAKPGWWDVCPYDPSSTCSAEIATIADLDACVARATDDATTSLVCGHYPMADTNGVDCPAQQSCGDGAVNAPGEQCDSGSGNSDTTPNACRTTCVPASCGDGVVDSGEQCDAGSGNSDTTANACRTTCVPASCGDGVVDTDEQCDNGINNSDTGACHTDCKLPSCGDGHVDAGEQCDNGVNNSDTTADACRTTCRPASCGDSVVDSSEECDAGSGNSDTTANACRTTCVTAFCGDGVVDSGEECDAGSSNSDTTADACGTTCLAATCGDGVVDSGEECDAGGSNSDTTADACRTTCLAATCGDGVVDSDEDCEGNVAGCNASACLTCEAGTFSAGSGTCVPWSDCLAGSYIVTDGTDSTDRTCANCPAGTTATEPNQATCVVLSCPVGTVQAVKPTPFTAPMCTACVPGEYCAGGLAPSDYCGVARSDSDSDPSTPCADIPATCDADLAEIAPPTLGPAPLFGISSTRSIKFRSYTNADVFINEHDIDVGVSQTVGGNRTNVFDASAFIDPSTCDQSDLRYYWRVTYIQVDGSEVSPFTDQGITGYITPKLTIKTNSMPAGNAYVDLKVASGAHPDQFTLTRIFFTVDSTTRALISYYLQCKATNTLCLRSDPNCLCFIPSLLPTTEPTS